MNTFEKFLDGQTLDIRDPQYVGEANTEMARCRHLCWQINQTDPADRDRILELEHELVPDMGEGAFITLTFQVDVGRCLHLGKNVFINTGLSMMSIGTVTIEDGVMIGPDVGFFTTNHDPKDIWRMSASQIRVGKNAWIGARANILPGVTIGEGAVVGTGSVVTKDVPAHTIVVGNPARVIRTIE